MRGPKWKKEHCYKLIAAYKKHPVLYNKAHRDYNSPKDREVAFMYIVDELQNVRPGTFLQEVKRRILNLRTQYFRHKKCVTEAAKLGKTYEYNSWCYNEMKFIEDPTIMEDPLDVLDNRNSTWFPDIDDDSEELENRRESEYPNETASSPQVEALEDVHELITIAINDESSEFTSQQEETVENFSQGSVDEMSRDNESMSAQSINPPEKLKTKPKTRKRPVQKSLQPTASSKKSKKELQSTPARSISETSQNTKEIEDKLNRLDSVTSEAYELMGNCTSAMEAHNRAFVENLLYDLDELSDEVLQRVKWQITNEVYEAFHNSVEQDKSKNHESK